jgi:hypothetical protein
MKLIVDLTDDAETSLRALEQRAGFGATRKSVVCDVLVDAWNAVQARDANAREASKEKSE